MKKLFVFVFFIFLYFNALAQIEVKPDSFKEIPGFVNQNTEIYDDDNNVLYAVIKVRTENFDDKQRHQLLFQGNAATFIELEYKQDEIWVYLSSTPATYLKISHPDFGSTEYEFPFDLKPQKGYEMVLVNKSASDSGTGSLTVITKPENGANIRLNGKPLNQLTPYTNAIIPAGKYRINVSKEHYESAVKTVNIKNGDNLTIEIDMNPIYGKTIITSEPSGATVFIDGKEYGVTPCEFDLIIGQHELQVAKTGWITATKQFILKENGKLKANVVLVHSPEGATSGLFSTGKTRKVIFSKGNLQYNPSGKTWRFAEKQYDFIGDDNEKIAPNYNGWIDLFGFGTGNNPTKSSTKLDDYKSFAEWGDNVISNGGGKVKQWQTMSESEWYYLLRTRETKSGLRYVKAMINDVNGVIILPDDWNPNTYELSRANDYRCTYYTNRITQSEWTMIFEPHGAVFLPAAGSRNGKSINNSGESGGYWTTTSGGSKAYHACFTNWDLNAGSFADPQSGLSVRLTCAFNDIATTKSYNNDTLKEPEYGKLSITSKPSGATVYINDKAVGVTPFDLDTIPVGTYDLKIWKKSHKIDQRQIVVQEELYIEVDATLEEGVDGVINSVFSVSPTQKVRFSKGNLQYRALTNTWRFAEHQWDVIGYSDANQKANSTDWRDLFGWGTGKKPMNTSEDIKTYSVFNDWGKNAIINGGNDPSIWRTLTSDEWVYLFDQRQTASGLRYVRATVNDKIGIIILPDSWNKKAFKFKKPNKGDTPFELNIVSLDDWNAIFETNGAVFLPAAGFRSVYYDDIKKIWTINLYGLNRSQAGYYWSSTRPQNDNEKAFSMWFDCKLHANTCLYGYSVRLVCPVK